MIETEPPMDALMRVRALYDFTAEDSSSLSFRAGDVIQVLTQLESGWWDGVLGDTRGWFPSNYVVAIENENDEEGDEGEEEEEEAAYWIPQATPEGRIYYFNTRTQVSTWEIPFERMDGTRESSSLTRAGRTAPFTLNIRPPMIDEDLSETEPVQQELQQNLQEKLQQVAVTANRLSLLTSQTNTDPLPSDAFLRPPPTLSALKLAIEVAVEALVELADVPAPQSFTAAAACVVEAVRNLLHAAGDMVFRESRILKSQRRQILAALSKLVLSARVASTVWPPPDATAKMIQDTLEVRSAASSYVELAKEIPWDLRYLGPMFVKIPRASSFDRSSVISLEKRQLTSAVQRDLEDYASEIKYLLKNVETIISLKQDFFASRLIGAVGQVADQTRKLISLLETINLDELQSSLSVNDFLISKQSVYDVLAAFIVSAQRASHEESAVDSLRSNSKDLDKAISGTVFNIQLLVGEREVAFSHRGSIPSETTDDLHPSTPKRGAKLKKFFGDEAPQESPTASKEEVPWYLGNENEGDMAYDEKGTVKGGTLPALVERLTRHDFWDSSFNNTFLLTYKSFTDAEELFQLLVNRFAITSPAGLTPAELEIWTERKQKPIRLRVFNILKTWLESYFSESPDCRTLHEIKHFAANIMANSIPGAGVLVKLVEKRMSAEDASIPLRKMVLNISQPPPEPVIPKNMKRIKFLDIDPLEIARQLTIIESKLYNKIRVGECLDKAWSRSDAEETAENIKAMILNSNQITGWVAEAILNQPEIKRRVNLLKQFILIAEKCRSLNNFSTLTAIVSALNSAPIHRLKRTWELVNARVMQTLEGLNKIMNSSRNFADYRETLHVANPPCVPFLGVYLTDLTFIEDGNSNYLKKSRHLINFSKRMKTAEVIREIQQYQSAPYHLKPVQELQVFLKHNLAESRDVHDMYEMSLSMEPREREDEKIARLLQESGFL